MAKDNWYRDKEQGQEQKDGKRKSGKFIKDGKTNNAQSIPTSTVDEVEH